eukprot:COSAG05_NODE_513_length_9084_cov_5.373957_6_plen_66_part_00
MRVPPSALTAYLQNSLQVFVAGSISVEMRLKLRDSASAQGGDFCTSKVTYQILSVSPLQVSNGWL